MSVLDEWSNEPKVEREPYERKPIYGEQLYEYTVEEIANELGISRNTVKNYIERATKKIRNKPQLKEWLQP